MKKSLKINLVGAGISALLIAGIVIYERTSVTLTFVYPTKSVLDPGKRTISMPTKDLIAAWSVVHHKPYYLAAGDGESSLRFFNLPDWETAAKVVTVTTARHPLKDSFFTISNMKRLFVMKCDSIDGVNARCQNVKELPRPIGTWRFNKKGLVT